jgi:hypothetical protein
MPYGMCHNVGNMKKTDAINHFGTQVALAAALGVDQSTISKSWGEFPPPLRQLQIEALTGGALKADSSILPSQSKKKKYRHKPVAFN